MNREPINDDNLVTVRCIDARWFQVRKGNRAIPDTPAPLQVPEWEVRNALARLIVAATSLDSAPYLTKLFKRGRYTEAVAFQAAANKHYCQVANKSKAHAAAAHKLADQLAPKD
jgi:hypothetical protein